VFDVTPRFGSPPDWDRLRADVRRAYDDALPLAARLAERERAYAQSASTHVVPPAVLWDDAASQSASVVEVRAHDSVGLLHRLTRVLAELDLDLRSARVSTLGAEVVDAFYVVEVDGRPVDDSDRRRQIEQALLTACLPAS
jgi:[protein-PII] uridylyltransferase